MDKINIIPKKINFDKEINNNKKLLEKYKTMKKKNIPIPKINDIYADEFLNIQIRDLEKRKSEKK